MTNTVGKIILTFTTIGGALFGTSAFSHTTATCSSLKRPFVRNFVKYGDTKLYAEGGAPQYDKIDAVLRQAEVVGDGSVMLHIDTTTSIEYEPGHVLALEIKGNDDDDIDSKTADDMKNNRGWMRGPYTVSRSTEKSLDVLLKVVGDKSKRFASAKPGTALKFGGKFKVPIIEGIANGENVKRVVLLSTGVGVGPCIGAIEKVLLEGSEDFANFPTVELYASYRTEREIVYKDHLDTLQNEHPERFLWKAIVSSESGRISSNEENLNCLFSSAFARDSSLHDTHYHLIGNGQMVNEFKAGLAKAGVPDDKVTTEMYFNHKAPVNDSVVDRIANAVTAGCSEAVASS